MTIIITAVVLIDVALLLKVDKFPVGNLGCVKYHVVTKDQLSRSYLVDGIYCADNEDVKAIRMFY